MLRKYLIVVAAGFSLFFAVSARAQYKLETCEDLKISEARYGGSVVETATCVNSIKAFSPKGTLRNVNILYSLPRVPTGAGVTFLITKDKLTAARPVLISVTPQHTTAYARLTINTPGKYFVRLVNYYNKSQVWATTDFTVGEDTVGPRAAGNTASGGGKVSICKEIDDDWKCVGQSNQWAANVPFNVLFENPTPSGVDFIGIVFHQQGPDGKDVKFINEYQQNIGETNRKYATVGDQLRLPAGVYSVYIIAWGKRESLMHYGNLTEYFAKVTLTVK